MFGDVVTFGEHGYWLLREYATAHVVRRIAVIIMKNIDNTAVLCYRATVCMAVTR